MKMKFLIEWDLKPKYRRDIMKAWEKYEQHKDVKTLLPVHNCVGSTRGIAVVETDSAEALEENLSLFAELINFTVTPILRFERPK
jgi:hypothetical protein